jgi:Ca2+/Na+ antiporter
LIVFITVSWFLEFYFHFDLYRRFLGGAVFKKIVNLFANVATLLQKSRVVSQLSENPIPPPSENAHFSLPALRKKFLPFIILHKFFNFAIYLTISTSTFNLIFSLSSFIIKIFLFFSFSFHIPPPPPHCIG